VKRPAQEPSRLMAGGARNADEVGAAELLERSLPVPEADDLVQERVWRWVSKSLPERRTSGSRRRWALGAAIASVTAAAVSFWALTRPSPALLELTAGPVLVASRGGSWSPAEAGTRVAEASRVRTDARSRAVLRLDRAAALVSSATDVAVESIGKTTFLRLSGGAVLAEVDPRRPGESFVVQTTRYRVTVKGTVFRVLERAEDDVEVSVSRGLVEVSGANGAWDVPAGHSWHSRHPTQLGDDEIPAADRSLVSPALRDGPRAAVRVEGEDELSISEGGIEIGPTPISWSAPIGHYHFVGRAAGGEAEGDAVAEVGSASTLRLAIPRPAPAPHPAIALAPPPAAAPDTPAAQIAPAPQVRRHATHANRPTPPPPLAPVVLPPPPPPAVQAFAPPSERSVASPAAGGNARPEPAPETPPIPDPRAARRDAPRPPPVFDAPAPPQLQGDALSQAIQMNRQGLYSQAASLFEAVADRGGLHAGLALYDYGRIQQLHLGHADLALAAYQRYEREYPRGPLLQEVVLSAIELELASPKRDGALAHMDRFLEQFPEGERAPHVHLLRGNLLRERGDCAGALREYARAGAPVVEDDALYFSAACQQQLGRAGDAAASLRDYQARFPQGHHAAEVRRALEGR
jgi:hypothetical protein